MAMHDKIISILFQFHTKFVAASRISTTSHHEMQNCDFFFNYFLPIFLWAAEDKWQSDTVVKGRDRPGGHVLSGEQTLSRDFRVQAGPRARHVLRLVRIRNQRLVADKRLGGLGIL